VYCIFIYCLYVFHVEGRLLIRVYYNRELGKYLDLRRMMRQKGEENLTVRNSIIFTLQQTLLGLSSKGG
jgi:hypothetical protein